MGRKLMCRIAAFMLVFCLSLSLIPQFGTQAVKGQTADEIAEVTNGEGGLQEAAKTDEGAPDEVRHIIRTDSVYYRNPLYPDAELPEHSDYHVSNVYNASAVETDYCESVEEAAEQAREKLKGRKTDFDILIKTALREWDGLIKEIMEVAMAHTRKPTEGDYIRWCYGGWGAKYSYYSSGGMTYITISYRVTYYTTAEQEKQMDARVAALLAELNLDSYSDHYGKLKAIYDYICRNVSYDYDNLENPDYKLKYTAYAALVNHTSVCQGYAAFFYRLALEAGVDVRMITGDAGGPHAWNIAKVGRYYYNLDSTFDYTYVHAGLKPRYFLLCDDNFTDHIREAEYATKEFYQAYPMGTKDYSPTEPEEPTEPEDPTEPEEPKPVSVRGTVTAKGTESKDAYIQIFKGSEIVWEDWSKDGSYSAEDLTAGAYTMKVKKTNYVTRSYDFTVSEGVESIVNVELHLIGDIDGDGYANMRDLNRLCDHVRNKNSLWK